MLPPHTNASVAVRPERPARGDSRGRFPLVRYSRIASDFAKTALFYLSVNKSTLSLAFAGGHLQEIMIKKRKSRCTTEITTVLPRTGPPRPCGRGTASSPSYVHKKWVFPAHHALLRTAEQTPPCTAAPPSRPPRRFAVKFCPSYDGTFRVRPALVLCFSLPPKE